MGPGLITAAFAWSLIEPVDYNLAASAIWDGFKLLVARYRIARTRDRHPDEPELQHDEPTIRLEISVTEEGASLSAQISGHNAEMLDRAMQSFDNAVSELASLADPGHWGFVLAFSGFKLPRTVKPPLPSGAATHSFSSSVFRRWRYLSNAWLKGLISAPRTWAPRRHGGYAPAGPACCKISNDGSVPGVLCMEPAALRNRRVILADPAARLAGRALRHHEGSGGPRSTRLVARQGRHRPGGSGHSGWGRSRRRRCGSGSPGSSAPEGCSTRYGATAPSGTR